MPFGNLSNDPYLLIVHRSHGSSTDKTGYTIRHTKSLVDLTPFKHYDLPEIVNIACTSPRLLLFAKENIKFIKFIYSVVFIFATSRSLEECPIVSGCSLSEPYYRS
jgi:hypothetical protein